MTIDREYFPSAEFCYFIYDPEGEGFIYYRSVSDRDADSSTIIDQYLDDGWDEAVEQIVAGQITHSCQKTDVQVRPKDEDLSEDGYDANGVCWKTHDMYCDYDLVALPPFDSLEERMKAAGMMTIDEMIKGAPMDHFHKHAGICNLRTFGQWLEMETRSYMRMVASRTLDKAEDDDLFEWVLSHSAVFNSVRINFRAALSNELTVSLEEGTPEYIRIASVLHSLLGVTSEDTKDE